MNRKVFEMQETNKKLYKQIDDIKLEHKKDIMNINKQNKMLTRELAIWKERGSSKVIDRQAAMEVMYLYIYIYITELGLLELLELCTRAIRTIRVIREGHTEGY